MPSVCYQNPLQMFYGNFPEFGNKAKVGNNVQIGHKVMN